MKQDPMKVNSIKFSSLLAWLLCGMFSSASAANASPPTPANAIINEQNPSGAPTHEQSRSIEQFADSLAAVMAYRQGQGQGNHLQPLYLTTGPKPPNGTYLCQVEVEAPPAHCPAPPSSDGVPPGPSPQCVLCEENTKERAWSEYTGTRLATAALRRLQTARARWGGSDLAVGQALRQFLAVRPGPAPRAAAYQLALGDMVSSTPETIEQHLAQLLASVSSARPLPSTEGRISLAQAEAITQAAKERWQSAYADWFKCRQDAHAAKRIPSGNPREIERCIAAASRSTGQTDPAAWTSFFQLREIADQHRVCLETNQSLAVSIARYQTTPCVAGQSM